MPITITMPALSPTMTEGKLATWHVAEGDEVSSGDVIAEIETDKATMEVEAVDEGVIGKILIDAGTENVSVNSPIAYLLEDGEDASALEGMSTSAAPAPAAAPAAQETASAPTAVTPAPAAPSSPQGSRVFSSPLARRVAADASLNIADIQGTGPRGRIIRADVDAFIAAGGTAKAAPAPSADAPAATPAPAAAPVVTTPPHAGEHEEIPLTGMRKTIAKRLTEAKQTIPHFYLTIECELDNLLAMRKELNSRGDDYKISVNDFIIRASALALKKLPAANAIWGGDKILQYKDIDISVAVAVEGGLITPVVKNADKRGLADISNNMKELAGKARDGKLMPEEYQGGCFSISNLGMFGIKEFSAVINPPQSAILAVGAGEQRPIVKDGELTVATMMSVTLSCDHRVIDGALGAELLKYFKGYIEEPLTMML
ncbi:pyruvate dehydrogenase complex dihydrolipoamide acetyltransferase [Sneathiella sp. P13V-1]|uniref:pyruvate dehydrogenase complex dihydrolipoamide acetyltransferase n=1 Tax=Sneathiella sp. P13V-1 TaxID=2697366 RepID=UPI00187B6287|nr:pyruvate dehydrogenase complex dihydrolipoamide acetyltransferase [Sneathiella sp. P13V-1]MBE7637314.1 pyruvate dehydrogenase complex dihydrolipoamide acetyltransferase [Sneathiella sp. P13V-1]